MQKVKTIKTSVSVKNLKKGMRIIAFTGFAGKFTNMDNKTCQWLKHNFKGTRAIIVRNGNEREIPMESLVESDSLNKIFLFPPTLKKLTLVTSNLVKELEKRGFTHFKVKQPTRL